MTCPNDTDGDGNCGQKYCPHCGLGRLPKPTEVTIGEDELRFLRQKARLAVLTSSTWHDGERWVTIPPEWRERVLMKKNGERV